MAKVLTTLSVVSTTSLRHGLSEKVVLLHADNCTTQNKNKCMVQCLAWRALTNHHTSITLSFLVVSHTKFSLDWCFGLFKRHYLQTKVGSLKSIARVVNDSAKCNSPQLVCGENGSTIVHTYDWTDFFAPHLKVIGIKNHHFRCDSSQPGVVFVKEHADTDEKIDLMKSSPRWSPDLKELPSVEGERQWYLYDSICPFCPDGDKDITCPLSDVLSQAVHQVHLVDTQPPDDDDAEPPLKRQRSCGTCRKSISHSCPNKEA